MMHLSRMALGNDDDGCSSPTGGAGGGGAGRTSGGSMLLLNKINTFDSTQGMKQQVSPKVVKAKAKKPSFMSRIGKRKSEKKG